MPGEIVIGLVDDHPLVVDGLAEICNLRGGMTVRAKGASAADAMDIARKRDCQVLVVDMNLPGDMCATIRQSAREHLPVSFVVYTASNDVQNCANALRAGARGYVLKGSPGQDLFQAIEDAAHGRSFVSPVLASRVIIELQRDRDLPAGAEIALTEREDQVVTELSKGKSNREIAASLQVSEKTVKYHMTQIMQKLNVRNRLEVVIEARRLREGNHPGNQF